MHVSTRLVAVRDDHDETRGRAGAAFGIASTGYLDAFPQALVTSRPNGRLVDHF
jgi:hypothetical protein